MVDENTRRVALRRMEETLQDQQQARQQEVEQQGELLENVGGLNNRQV